MIKARLKRRAWVVFCAAVLTTVVGVGVMEGCKREAAPAPAGVPSGAAGIVMGDAHDPGAKAEVASVGSLPAAAGGARLLAAGKFEPSGKRFPEGLSVTWPLGEHREPGSTLWIVVLDEAQKKWLGTGERARVGASGMDATGRLYHFSYSGVQDKEPAEKEAGGGATQGSGSISGLPAVNTSSVARLATLVEVKKGGSAEAAMVAYTDWVKGGGQGVIERARAMLAQDRALPRESRPQTSVFERMPAGDQEAIRKVMVELYGKAGGDSANSKDAFHIVALLLDKGLQNPSEQFIKEGRSAGPISNELSLVMAQARDTMIDRSIIAVAERNGWKVRRSDSGNDTSGLKSDMDQTFYVYEPDGQGGWKRAVEKDKVFVEQFEAHFEEANKKLNDGKLGLGSLDIASFEGKHRFPDPRLVELEHYSKEYRATVIALRNTPGAYTTYGAVLQQMQLRALDAILKDNPRAFRGYGPANDKPGGGKTEKLAGYTHEEAIACMFGEGMRPDIMQGLSFGAAVANLMELSHYMHEPKFEVKYHLRTVEDAVETLRLVSAGKGADEKEEFKSILEKDPKRVDAFLEKLFPRAEDIGSRQLHKIALETSLRLRLLHKNEAIGSVGPGASDAEKSRAVFGDLARALYKESYNPTDATQMAEAEQIHRKLARELCVATVYHTADDAFKMVFDPKTGRVDMKNVRPLVDAKTRLGVRSEADWAKYSQNLAEGTHITLLYAFYDLGFFESRRLRDHLASRFEGSSWELDKLWFRGQFQGIESIVREPGVYANIAGEKLDLLQERVQEHVLTELGFEHVPGAKVAGHALEVQNLTWNWRKFARSKTQDPGSLLSLANVLRTAINTKGDAREVLATLGDEMFLNWVPILGQLESARRGDAKDLMIMATTMYWPLLGEAYMVYQLGSEGYGLYYENFAAPREDNLIDAAYRGFVGPETRAFGEPGKPPPTWSVNDPQQLDELYGKVDQLRKNLNLPVMQEAPATPTWPPNEWAEAAKLANAAMEAKQKDAALEQQTIDLRLEISKLEERKQEFAAYVDGPWTGDLLGFGGQPTQKFVPAYLLDEVTPTVGFFTKGVVDLRITWTAADQKKLEDAEAAAKSNATPVDKRVEASVLAKQLTTQKAAAERAAGYRAKIDKWPELKYRFKRDSLYLYLREKYKNTTDQQFNAWFDERMKADKLKIGQGMVDQGLIGAAATQATRLEGNTPLEGGMTLAANPFPEDKLRERAKADLERSRLLSVQYENMEKRRLSVDQRNQERAKSLLAAENAGQIAEKLKDDPAMMEFLTALRYLAIPRHAPELSTTIYKVAADGKATAYAGSQEYGFEIKTHVKADPTLYYPEYEGAPEGTAEQSGLYYTDNQFVDVAAAQAAAGGGADQVAMVKGVPLLASTRELLAKVLKDNKAALEGGDATLVITSMFASDMPDMTQALPATYMHLPSVKSTKVTWKPGINGPLGATAIGGKNRYLMAQTVGFIPAPKALKGQEIWYVMEDFPVPGIDSGTWRSQWRPIAKLTFADGGAIGGTCAYAFQDGDIIETLNLDFTGNTTAATGQIHLHFDGKYTRKFKTPDPRNGHIGTAEALTGDVDGGGTPDRWFGNASMASKLKLANLGTSTSTFTYIDNIPVAGYSKEDDAAHLALTGKARSKEVQTWSFSLPQFNSVSDGKNPKVLRGTFSTAAGTFKLDQWGLLVDGTVELPGGDIGAIRGNATSEIFTFKFNNGRNGGGGEGELNHKAGATEWTGFVLPDSKQKDKKTVITLPAAK